MGFSNQPVVELRLTPGRCILNMEMNIHGWMDALDRLARYHLECCTQRFVARYQLLECTSKSRYIQIAKNANRTCHIERNSFGQKLVEEPERLLAVRKRTLLRSLLCQDKRPIIRRRG